MRIAYFPNQVALNGRTVMPAFLDGCRYNGISPVANSMDADMAVIWSMLWAGRMANNQQIWNHYRAQNKPVIVIEVGMLNRNRTWRVGINGVNAKGYFGSKNMDDVRRRSFGVDLRPWRTRGQHILIATQRSDSAQWQGMPPVQQWIDTVISQIRSVSDRPICLRVHPRQKLQRIWPGVDIDVAKKLAGTYDEFDFERVLEDCWAVINWSSNPGPQAILHGVPAFVGPDSLANPVAMNDLAQIETPLTPDRDQWFNDLCYTEWTTEELSRGLPVQRLLHTKMM